MVIAIISESRSPSPRNADRHRSEYALLDNDPPHPFLEIHPISDLMRTAELPADAVQAITPPPPTWPRKYRVMKGDCLSWIAERTYGTQSWQTLYAANRRKI